MSLSVEVPANVTANIRLGGAGRDTTEGVGAIADAPGITGVTVDGEDLLVAAGSGRYAFVRLTGGTSCVSTSTAGRRWSAPRPAASASPSRRGWPAPARR